MFVIFWHLQVFTEMLIDALDEALLGGVWEAMKAGGAPPVVRIKGRDKVGCLGSKSVTPLKIYCVC